MKLVHFCLILLFVSACSGPISRSNVTHFYQPDQRPVAGSSIFIKPGSSQAHNETFKQLAYYAAQEFQQAGFQLAASEQEANYIALIDYAVEEPVTETHIVPIYGFKYDYRLRSKSRSGWAGYHGFIPTREYTVVERRKVQKTFYSKQVRLRVLDPNRLVNGYPYQAFDSIAQNKTEEANFLIEAPCLIAAIFEGYATAKESGVTQEIRVEKESCQPSTQLN